MIGEKNRFKKLLWNDVDIPSVFAMECTFHSIVVVCANHAVNVLLSYLEAFFKDVTSYFSRSSKRERIL